MADQFFGEIRLFAFGFAPQGWALCDGSLMPLQQNTYLFALLGTQYGGDGKTTFALPSLQGRVPMAPTYTNQPPTQYYLGQTGGTETVALQVDHLPAHNHVLSANAFTGDNSVPGPSISLAESTGGNLYAPPASPQTPMGSTAVSTEGGDTAHQNMMPSLVMNFCISLTGLFPERN